MTVSHVGSIELLGAPPRVKLKAPFAEDSMSQEALDKLRAQALTLSDGDRAALAYDLVKSLDEPADADAATEWDKEIVRRLRAIDSGTAKLVDREEVSRRFKERLGHR